MWARLWAEQGYRSPAVAAVTLAEVVRLVAVVKLEQVEGLPQLARPCQTRHLDAHGIDLHLRYLLPQKG